MISRWKYRSWILAVGFGLLMFHLSKAQQADAKAELDTNTILIGDQVNLMIMLALPAGNTAQFPPLKDTITTQIEIVKQFEPDTLPEKGEDEIYLVKRLVITSFDTGYHAIPPFRIILNEDTANYIETEPLLLQVQGVEVNPEEDIKAIKGPMDYPFTFKEVLFFVGVVFLALLLIGLVVFYFIQRKKPGGIKEMMKPKPLPPHEVALAKLEKLRREKLWQDNQYKEYHSRLSEIVREYIEKRFGVPALEQVTDEITRGMKGVVSDEWIGKLRQILSLADLVKYAKQRPLPDENERGMKVAMEFVHATKPVEKKEGESDEPKKEEEPS